MPGVCLNLPVQHVELFPDIGKFEATFSSLRFDLRPWTSVLADVRVVVRDWYLKGPFVTAIVPRRKE